MTFGSGIRALALSMFVVGCSQGIEKGENGGGSGGEFDGGVQKHVCASDDAYTPFSSGMTSSYKGLTVAIESEPAVPSPGDHSTWKLTITDEKGPIAAGTKISVTCSMTHSSFSHPCPTVGVKDLGNGVYEASPVIFNMQGHWHVNFGVGAGYVPIELCVE
jgi:hypothetical protein